MSPSLLSTNMKNFWSLSAAGLALSFALVGCGSNNATTDTAPEGAMTSDANAAPAGGAMSDTKINAAGATFPYPIYTKWFDDYKNKTGVEINYQAVGSGAGIKQLKNNTVDFAGSDAPLKDKDMKDMPGEVIQFPSVGGAVVVAYNVKGAPENLKMTGPLVADIFMGKIKNWNDPAIAAANPGVKLPAVGINPAHRSDGSGTTNIFTTYLSQVSPEWKTKMGAGKTVDWPGGVGGKGNDGVTSAIRQGDGGIGYIELAYAMQNKINVAAIKNKAGNFVVPSAETTTNAIEGALPLVQADITAPISNADGAQAYPIAALTYILVYKQGKSAEQTKATVDFLKWAMTDGQPEAAKLDYAPLPQPLIDINMKAIEQLK